MAAKSSRLVTQLRPEWSEVERIRQAFHESFAAAFTDTLRLNVILPITIAILTIVLLRKKEGIQSMPLGDPGA